MKKHLARAVAALGVLAAPAIASAQNGPITITDINRIGGLLAPIRPANGTFSIAELIVIVFNYLIIIAGVLALFYLIWAGISYITAGQDDAKAGKAKTGIFNAIIGIVVILISYLIISWVSNLVRTTVPGGQTNQPGQNVLQPIQ
jgi:hypothetical protein